jgi:hypothetical protein
LCAQVTIVQKEKGSDNWPDVQPSRSAAASSAVRRAARLINDVEVRHASLCLASAGIGGHQNDAITAGREVFHHHHHADGNDRAAF